MVLKYHKLEINPKYKLCIINGVEYRSISDAAKELGVSRGTINNWLNANKEGYICMKY